MPSGSDIASHGLQAHVLARIFTADCQKREDDAANLLAVTLLEHTSERDDSLIPNGDVVV